MQPCNEPYCQSHFKCVKCAQQIGLYCMTLYSCEPIYCYMCNVMISEKGYHEDINSQARKCDSQMRWKYWCSNFCYNLYLKIDKP